MSRKGMRSNSLDSNSASRWAVSIAAILFLMVDLTMAESGFRQRTALAPRRTSLVDLSTVPRNSLVVRGGASLPTVDSDDEDEDSDYDEEDEEDITEQLIHELEKENEEEDDDENENEEDEEKEILDPKLTAAAVKSSVKTKAKAEAAKVSKVKEAVNVKLSTKTTIKKKSVGSLFRLPYIMRACLNPITAYAMTKAFWVSLFNLDYPPKDTSQDLRSSLEEKNRKAGGGSSNKPKRKMKRGQAKTLSDLPQLNT